jgi:iron complex transport system ATP-binding protein
VTGAGLSLDGVRVHRADRDILHIDRLSVAPQEFLAVLGRNGAGKSTLLRVCCGLLRPTTGQVRLDGRDPAGPGAPTVRRAIGYLPQSAEYNPDLPLTVEEVVRLGRAARRGLLRRFTREDREATRRWLDHVGLTPLRRRTFRTLSGGEQQKALLARAMVQRPSLLLLDEPGAHLDLDWRRRLTDLIERIYRETRLTVVMVSHDVGLIPACCTTVALMDDGRIAARGAPEEVLDARRLTELYGCPVHVWEHEGRHQAVAASDADRPHTGASRDEGEASEQWTI